MRSIPRVVAALFVLVALLPTAAAARRDDPLRPRQWALDRMQVQAAWPVATGKGVLVAVIDSGVDLTHPDLARQLVLRPGADLADPDGCSSSACVDDGAQDTEGHGTAVAGIIAARTGNGRGVAGIAPDARILPIRIRTPEGVRLDLLDEAITFAVDQGAGVIVMAISSAAFPRAIEEAVPVDELVEDRNLDRTNAAIDKAWERGVVMLAAAGNGFPHSFMASTSVPAVGVANPVCSAPAFNVHVVCVGAVDRNDTKAHYSHYDATQGVTYFVAPSGADESRGPVPQALLPCDDRIVTTSLRGGATGCAGDLPDGYSSLSGTSAAVANAGGVAALLVGLGLTNEEVVDRLLTTADDLGVPGRDPLYGWGRVNARRAVGR